MKRPKTVLIVQRPGEYVDVAAQWLRDAGYEVRLCSGPTDLRYDCWAHVFDDCPLWHQADLVIYDPWIASSYHGQDQFALERQRHPEMPLLTWGPSAVPADIAALEQSGEVEILPADLDRETLIGAVQRKIGSAEAVPV